MARHGLKASEDGQPVVWSILPQVSGRRGALREDPALEQPGKPILCLEGLVNQPLQRGILGS